MDRTALEGVRVADFSWAWAGPHLTMLLADMGAEVINIETYPRTSHLRMNAPFPQGQREGVNSGGWWSASYRGKLSCSVNLKHPKGNELAKQIVAISDLVVENFSVGVMARLGLDYDVLKQIKPDIVYIGMSGYGAVGPESNRVSYGSQIGMSAGVVSLTGHPHASPAQMLIPFADPVAGLTGAFAVLAALHYRSRTGRGQYIDLSQAEAMACFVPESLMDYTMNGNVRTRVGNRDESMTPHGCYPCKGDNEWATIAVSSDEEWGGFCEALGNPNWTRDPKFTDGSSRWKNQDELDARVAEWTIRHSSYDVMKILQNVGVASTPTLNGADIVNDPHLNDRGFFVHDPLPVMKNKPMAGPTWKMSRTPGRIRRPAPRFGEHNEYVLGELLGLSKDEIGQLSAEKVIAHSDPKESA